MKNIDERRNYFIKEIEQNELMSKKYKNFSTILNYIEHFLFLASAVTGCISISAFASLLRTLIGNMSSAIGSKIFVITVAVKKYKSIIMKKISLTDSYFSLVEFVLVNNESKDFDDMIKEIKNLKT